MSSGDSSAAITLHRCVCGWITVHGSIHGCVKCLRFTPPKPFQVVALADVVDWIRSQAEEGEDAYATADSIERHFGAVTSS
jgi:hypothetical protein